MILSPALAQKRKLIELPIARYWHRSSGVESTFQKNRVVPLFGHWRGVPQVISDHCAYCVNLKVVDGDDRLCGRGSCKSWCHLPSLEKGYDNPPWRAAGRPLGSDEDQPDGSMPDSLHDSSSLGGMKTPSDLIEFVEREMTMSHVYQPVLIRALVRADGSATLRQLV